MIDRITEQPFCQTRVMCRAVDNLELLLSQPDESVDLIYCDILYGTGRNFGDYQDLKPIRSEIESHYLPRLKEMHRVLKSTGSIYLQMDTKINHWMRVIMDDIFGYDNFRSEIVWGYNGRQKYNALKFQGKHDILLFYSKTEKHKLNDIRIEWDRESRLKVMRRKILVDDNGIEYFIDNRGVANGTPKKKVILSEYLNKGGSLSDLWCDISMVLGTDNQKINYATQKPKSLIERIIKVSSNEGDVVADYYLGSGTTAVVCKELNRNFIGCDINPKAIEITNARLDAVS
jgi:site-specific DNA-methyltransferase (adenine-specific)